MFLCSFKRMDMVASTGVGLEFIATTRGWFVGVQPLAIDFRYWERSSTQSITGFAQIFPVRISVGHEF